MQNIFDNDYVRDSLGPIRKLYSNKATFKWKDGKYVHNYDEDKVTDDPDIPFIKFKDLGKKQYNYDSKLYKSFADINSEIRTCYRTSVNPPSSQPLDGNGNKCEYLWGIYEQTSSITNKYIYDRWLTTIILGVLVAACGVGLAIFGVLLFLNGNSSSSGHTPV